MQALPTFGRSVYLQVPRRQFCCSGRQRYSTERLEFFDWKRRHTGRYEAKIYERVQQSSLEQIGREEGLNSDEIKSLFDHVYQQRKNNWEPSKRLYLDESSLRKGQQDFVTVVSDVEQGILIEVLDSQKAPPVLTYLDRGWGASILKAGLRLWDGTLSPVATIKVTYHNRRHPTSLIHETEHQVAHILGWNMELAAVLAHGLGDRRNGLGEVWSISWLRLTRFQGFAGKLPQNCSIAACSIRNPAEPLGRLCPYPGTRGSLRKEGVLFVSSLSRDPVARCPFNAVDCPTCCFPGKAVRALSTRRTPWHGMFLRKVLAHASIDRIPFDGYIRLF